MKPTIASTGRPYLTYKLDLLKTLATRAADAVYAAETGLSTRELRVIRPLHDHPGITATGLRQLLVLDKTLMSKNLATLQARGLIRRQTDAADHRAQRLHLTAAGQRAWKRCEQLGRTMETEMFCQLSRRQWDTLHGLLDAALDSLNAWQQVNGAPAAARPRRKRMTGA